MTIELRIVQAHSDVFPEDFVEYLRDNLHVWRAFVRETFKVRAKRFKHHSSKAIVHDMRHNSSVVEVGSGWKLNNNHTPYLARLFDLRFPGLAGMWEFRDTPKVRRKRSHDRTED
jgi:phosphoribosylanthranilate isomerase